MNRYLASGLGMTLGLLASASRADDVIWHAPRASGPTISSTTPASLDDLLSPAAQPAVDTPPASVLPPTSPGEAAPPAAAVVPAVPPPAVIDHRATSTAPLEPWTAPAIAEPSHRLE